MSFEKAMEWILHIEGGYAEPPRIDQPTKYGITIPTLSDWWGEKADKEDIKSLSVKEASDIYRAKYWNPIKADCLPSGLALVTFDSAINSGQGHAIRWLQAASAVKADGIIGPKTVLAAKSVNQPEAINDYINIRSHFIKTLKDYKKYGKGWEQRLVDLKIQAFRI